MFISRVAYRLGRWAGPQPDLAVILKKRLHLVKRGYVAGAPPLAMEIVSPDSVERDYDFKRRQFEKAGVDEYWIVDKLPGLWKSFSCRRESGRGIIVP